MPGLEDYRIAIIGAGKIGRAFIRVLNGRVREILATGRREETLARAQELGAVPLTDNGRAASMADIVILSVKPYQLPQVVNDIAPYIDGKIVISIIAGVRRATVQARLSGATVFRAMPNINALIGGSTTAVARFSDYDPRDMRLVEDMFKLMGRVYWIPEEWLDTWTGLVGSGPAYLAEIIDALVLGAVSMGLPREIAYDAILDVMENTSRLLRESNRHPAELRDEVTTPAGTTIHGLKELEARGVKAALMNVVEAASRRGRDLGAEIDRAVREALGLE